MGKFYAARVKFTPNGRTYPVNCAGPWVPGDRVIVRMDGTDRRLVEAEIVEEIITNSACKNSIVCTASEAENYGQGPDVIATADGLTDWLLRRGWKGFDLADTDFLGRKTEWRQVFIQPEHDDGIRIRPYEGKCIFLGPEGSGKVGSSFDELLQRNKSGMSVPLCIVPFKEDRGNVYRQCAEYSEPDYAPNQEPECEPRRWDPNDLDPDFGL